MATVARHGGQALGKTIARHHIDANGVDKLLYLGRYASTCCGEEVRFEQTYLLAHHAEDGFVDKLILH